MSPEVSLNTKAILLLTAPLVVGRGGPKSSPLSPAEYVRIARKLHDLGAEPADLLGPNKEDLVRVCAHVAERERMEALLNRGFLLSQAIERWASRAIWVISRADTQYPRRFKARVKEDTPPVIYGCGDPSLLATGGLAVVGSRHVSDELVSYAEGVGRLAAGAGTTIVSGGARGIDQAAMRGALEAGGIAIGVLADKLEKSTLNRENRRMLLDGRLVLISPYDPSAGFNVGHAMRRNKLVYALADLALVVSSDYRKGGTWAGAVEQLEKLKYVPVFVRTDHASQPGLSGLQAKGALSWKVTTAEQLSMLVKAPPERSGRSDLQSELALIPGVRENSSDIHDEEVAVASNSVDAPLAQSPADELFAAVRRILSRVQEPRTEDELANDLRVGKAQARTWLKELVDEGTLERLSRPVRYRSVGAKSPR